MSNTILSCDKKFGQDTGGGGGEVTRTTMLRYFNFEPSFKLRWCRARDLFGSQIPVTTGGFELRISCIQSSYLTY